MKTKQELIKEAYADNWYAIGYSIDKDGWIINCPLQDGDPINYSSCGYKGSDVFTRRGSDPYHFDWRLKVFWDIDQNNGWVKIEDSIPPNFDDQYHFQSGDVYLGVHYGVIGRRQSNPMNITHWKPIEETEPPLH